MADVASRDSRAVDLAPALVVVVEESVQLRYHPSSGAHHDATNIVIGRRIDGDEDAVVVEGAVVHEYVKVHVQREHFRTSTPKTSFGNKAQSRRYVDGTDVDFGDAAGDDGDGDVGDTCGAACGSAPSLVDAGGGNDLVAQVARRGSLVRILDLANLRSVLAVQTEDLGVRRGDGFELLGRAVQVEARGCSLMDSDLS